jgi:hypothetical protein
MGRWAQANNFEHDRPNGIVSKLVNIQYSAHDAIADIESLQ